MSTPGSAASLATNNSDAVTQEAFDALKRKYDQLVHKSGIRNQCGLNGPTTEERARGIRKLASLYMNVSGLVTVALVQEEGGGDEDADETMPEEEWRRLKIE